MNWKDHVKHDKRLERPCEVDLLIGDAAKAKFLLGWQPKVSFDGLVKMMVEADMNLAVGERAAKEAMI